jgi:hypothetical protein
MVIEPPIGLVVNALPSFATAVVGAQAYFHANAIGRGGPGVVMKCE